MPKRWSKRRAVPPIAKVLRQHILSPVTSGVLVGAVGVSGALYAMRRSLFQPIPPGTVLDDVLVPMRVAAQGKRVVFGELSEFLKGLGHQPLLVAADLQRLLAHIGTQGSSHIVAGDLNLTPFAWKLALKCRKINPTATGKATTTR